MPLVFPVVLLLVLGAATLTSRSTTSLLAASKQADAESAREAAESGMNRLVGDLNPFLKLANEPYLSFLLAAKWDSGNSRWILSGKSKADVVALLSKCGISTRGIRTDNEVPDNPGSAILSRTIQIENNRTLIYRVVDFSMAEDPQMANLDKECRDNFNTTTGGSAQVTIEGIVTLQGKEIARHRLVRKVDFQGTSFPSYPNSFLLGAISPGVPVSLRIGNGSQSAGLDKLAIYVYKNNDPNEATESLLDNTLGKLRPLCESCTSATQNGMTGPNPFSQGTEADIPDYLKANCAKAECLNSAFDKNGSRFQTIENDVIIDSASPPSFCSTDTSTVNCYIKKVESNSGNSPEIRVNTNKYPVNLFVKDGIGDTDEYVKITHDNFDASNPTSRTTWSRLRILSDPEEDEDFYITADSLNGSFLWLAKGTLHYGSPSETLPAKILATWWVRDLDIQSSGTTRFIMPLYGNPDALSSLFPGGSSYPILMRPRSTY